LLDPDIREFIHRCGPQRGQTPPTYCEQTIQIAVDAVHESRAEQRGR
jgi:hypothetical protein